MRVCRMEQKKFLFVYGLIVAFFTIMFLRLKFKNDRPSSLNLRKMKSVTGNKVEAGDEEELNIYFKFQGKMWDAYEVMGVPAGSTMAEVQKAYERAATGGPSEEIVILAYKAIRQKLKEELF